MVKKNLVKVVVSLAVLAAVDGSSDIVIDSLGVMVASSVHACANPGGSGGGC